MHRVIVLGAGYAGLPAVNRLARQTHRDEVEVVLVNDRASFVERPRLHQVATGQPRRDLPIEGYLKKGVALRLAAVRAIDTERRGLQLDAEVGRGFLEYDTLLYAAGSSVDVDTVSGVRQHASSLSDPESARRISEKLGGQPDAHVTVCGGGLTGLEAATEIAERYPRSRVALLTDGPVAGWLSPRASSYVRRALEELRIDLVENTRVARVDSGSVTSDAGDHFAHDLCVWAGGFTVPRLAADAGLAVDSRGRIITDRSLRAVNRHDIFVAGDAAAVPGPWGEALAMGCRTGGFTGPTAADSIVARLTGREPPTFTFRYVHECISLGRRRAVVQFLKADGSASARTLRGRPAQLYKNLILDSARLVFSHPGPLLPRRRHIQSTASSARAA